MDFVYDIRISNALFSQLIVCEYAQMFFGTLGLILSVINYERRLIGQEGEFGNKVALFCNFMCTLFLVFSIYSRYDLWLKWSITMQEFTIYDDLYNTGIYKEMIAEMFLNIIAPMPFFNGKKYEEYVEAYDVTVIYEINDILLFVSFLRVYLVFKFILYLTQFMGPRPHRVCHFNNCDASTMFAVKGLMKQRPY